MSFYNSNYPYTYFELVNKLSSENGCNERNAKKKINQLIKEGTIKKHVESILIGHKAYKIVLYVYSTE